MLSLDVEEEKHEGRNHMQALFVQRRRFVANGEGLHISHNVQGRINTNHNTLKLNDVLVVPNMKQKNLLSTSKLTKMMIVMLTRRKLALIQSCTNKHKKLKLITYH